MAKLFGLFVFLHFVAAGVLLGRSRRPLTVSLCGAFFAYFTAVYLLCGLIFTLNPEFLHPK